MPKDTEDKILKTKHELAAIVLSLMAGKTCAKLEIPNEQIPAVMRLALSHCVDTVALMKREGVI